MSVNCREYNCPVEATIQLIGGKMLAQQLRELERDGLISRKVYPVVPPKTEYSLTDFGKSLTPILDELCKWGEDYLNKVSMVQHNDERC